ncbi:MAG: ATP-binding cassette domain-containing protein [Actinobacteria bacterium]|nr:ATP-binding cassette domain-containing protein [Actinomycetota bacterium]
MNGRLLIPARALVTSVVLLGIVSLLGLLYTSTGGSSRDSLVDEMLVNLVLVLGMQVFIGNTGVLSFGHLAFAEVAAYATAIVAIPVAAKAKSLPDIPFGLADVHLGAFGAIVAGVAVATIIGALVGLVVARAMGLAPTMITLAVLVMFEQVVKNWQELTRGAGGLSGVPIIGSSWLYVSALLSLFVACAFQQSRVGRFAVATREDELAAPALGVGLFSSRYGAWVVSMALMGLGGSMLVLSLGSVNPKQFTLDRSILVLAMLVLGGMRTVTGAVTGTALVTAGNELFRQLGDKWKIERFPDLFLGGVLLAVMLLRPGGLLGDLDILGWLRQRWRPASRSATPPPRERTLVAEDIVVDFGGFRALDEAAIRVRPGEVVGLIGPNGAGETTPLSSAAPYEIARSGLARTFQNLRVFKNLSVRENVELTSLVAWKHRGGGPSTDELLDSAGLTAVADRPAGTLDYGNQRRLELVRAAALAPDFLLLDEPTSGMSDAESLAMVDRVRATAAALGCGVLVIDHDLGFITRISDHMVVLAEGRVLAEGTPQQVRADPAVAAAYLGSRA